MGASTAPIPQRSAARSTDMGASKGPQSPDARQRPGKAVARLLLVHAAGATGPVGFAELELLELAGGCPDERVTHLDGGRALVVRHPASTMLDEVTLGGGRARSQHDERLDGL